MGTATSAVDAVLRGRLATAIVQCLRALRDTNYDGLEKQYNKVLCGVERSVGLVNIVLLWPC